MGEQTDRLLADRDLQMTTATLPVGRDGRTHEFLQFPITSSHGRIFAIGVMALECPKDRVSDRAERALEHSNKVNAELRRLVEDLEVYAHTDRLTGAWNRRWLEEAVLNELSRFERYGHPVSIIILDIDHFKRINDEHGHLTGDQVLQEVAARVRATDRGSDSLVRWGGEEFIVLSPNTPLVAAGRLAERLREAISAQPIDAVGTVTCSFGVAEYGEGETWKEWLERADQALYAAKNGGRDRVELDSAGEQTARATDRTAPGFLQLVWRKAYNSDHPVIDEQHRQLFFLANELLGAVLDSRSREAVERIALNLVRALEDHFAAEEVFRQ